MLIVRYFGQVQPVAQQAMRALPHVANQLSRSMAGHKRIQASNKVMSDSELIEELFKSHNKTEK